MHLSPDDARTDVILVAAAAVLGLTLRSFVVSLPLYPAPGLVSSVLDLGWIVAMTALVPTLLARHRGDGAAAFGIGGPDAGGPGGRGALAGGLALAIPAVALGVAARAVDGGTAAGLLLGRAGLGGGPAELVVSVAAIGLFALGSLTLVGFLAVRSRDAFPRSPTQSVTASVRTIGLGAVAVAAVTGTLQALGRGSFALLGLHLVALAAVLLLADRLVPVGLTAPRAAVAGPLTVVTVAYVFAGGGMFGGDLIGALYRSGLAAGVTLAVAALAQTRRGTLAAVPLLVAVHWWPTCLSPLAFTGGSC